MFSHVPAWLDWSYEQYPLPPWFFRWFAKSAEEGASGQAVALTIDSFVAGYFVFHSFFMLLGTAIVWVLIVRKLNLGFTARWLGFIGLFVNVAVMKMSFYYPTLTDTTALFVATLMLYGYILNSSWILFPAAIIGFFTFPTAFYVAALLFIFPRTTHTVEIDNVARMSTRSVRLIAGGVVGIFLLASLYFVVVKQVRFAEVEPVIPILLFLTIPLLLAQVYWTIAELLSVFPLQAFMRHLVATQSLFAYGIRVVLSLMLWGILLYWKKQIEDPSLASPMNTDLFFGGSFASAVGKPLLPLVAAAVYFGPMVLFIVLRFRQFIRTALELGNGYFLVISAMLVMATIMTETRQLINFLPFLVLGVACMLDKISLPPIALILFSILALVSSKIWLPFNFPGMSEQAANITDGIYATFPLQTYFMNHGPWMSMTSYLIQGVGMLCCCGLLLWMLSPQFDKR